MASDSIRTLLSTKLAGCFIEGTSGRDPGTGVTVSTNRLAGEIILFFHTDCDEGRRGLGIVGENLKTCDYLVLYTKANNRAEVICFLELKGKHLQHAVQQILNTYRHLKLLVESEVEREQQNYITWKVCICMHGQAPRNDQRSVNQLIREFKSNVRIKHGVKHDKDLGAFLRG